MKISIIFNLPILCLKNNYPYKMIIVEPNLYHMSFVNIWVIKSHIILLVISYVTSVHSFNSNCNDTLRYLRWLMVDSLLFYIHKYSVTIIDNARIHNHIIRYTYKLKSTPYINVSHHE